MLWQRTDETVELDLTTAHPAGVAKLLSGRNVLLSEIVREPGAREHARQQALAIKSLATELMEERGIISLFLALGRVTWDISGDVKPAAPVLLRQCDIHPGGREGDDLVFEVSRTAELNAALATYMASRGVNIDTEYISSLSHGPHGFDPAPAYDMLRRAGASIPGFHVADKLIVSTFSYAKLSMVRDVAEQRGTLSNHPVIAAMAGDQASAVQVGQEIPHSGLDADPRDEFLVLDADSHQQAAIDACMAGQHLVLMGPPGTGKSQTIANLIATLTAHGRSALFVAEKRAAIDAVVGRLGQVGLKDLVLDAHAGSGTAADLVQSLARRLVTAPAFGATHVASALHSQTNQGELPLGAGDSAVTQLDAERFTLLEHVRALHRIRDPFGISAYDAQQHLTSLASRPQPPRSRVRLSGEPLQRLDAETRDTIARTLVALARRNAWRGDGEADPWFSTSVRGEEQMERTRSFVTRLAEGGLAGHRARLRDFAERAGLPVPSTMQQASEQLDLIEHIIKSLHTFTPDVFTDNLPGYVFASGNRTQRKSVAGEIGMMERRRLLKEARAALRPGRQPSDLHGALERAAAQQQRWQELGGTGQPNVPSGAEDLIDAHADLMAEFSWLSDRLVTPTSEPNLVTMDLDEVDELVRTLHANTERLEVLPAVATDLGRLRAQGLGAVIDDFAARGLSAEEVVPEWEHIWYGSVLERIREQDPAYETNRGDELRVTAQRFAQADRDHLKAAPRRVRERAYRRIDAVAEHYPEQVEAMETALVFGHHAGSSDALRQAFAEAPDLMTSLAPCWAMSPLVVAQTVPPGQWFDVVIFDEASQIPTAEAISAISRGAQIVVAGDTQQLAPTSFFQRTRDGEDTAHTGESVLDVLSKLLPTQYLTWHYRSRDERLIAFSNQAVYGGELMTFPQAEPTNVMRLHVVRGYSNDGEWAAQQAGDEIARVVHLVREHIANRPDESLGVITLGLNHARAVERALAKAAQRQPALADYLAARGNEPFFVKNLERVQGDERDAIILTLGISPNSASSLVRRFGALNHAGGERRLNVAITRARRRMDVVSGFAGEDLDPNALRSRGATMLRDYLLYVAENDETYEAVTPEDGVAVVGGKRRLIASTGSVALQRQGGDVTPYDVPYVIEDLAERLRAQGLEVMTGYGHSRARIDLAIVDPRDKERMLLAVESDGPQYAAMGNVRERDRLRIEALARHGWQHDRVWTVDLFRDPARDASRILERVSQMTGMNFLWDE